MHIQKLDIKIIAWCKRAYIPLSRIAFFIIFFYFGLLKLIGQSPASPLAETLTARTIGMDYYQIAFVVLAIFECLIGILFLIPKATRIVIPLLFAHLAIVCSPLVLVPEHVWSAQFVPTLEGQYIIKNVALAAIAIGIAANTMPLGVKKSK